MPQLDPSSYVSQVFWLLVSFFLMLVMMKFVVIPRISIAIEERKRNIESYVKKAEKLQQEALASLEKYNAMIDEAKQTAEEQTKKAETELKSFIEEKSAETSEMLAAKIADNEKIIADERREALDEIANISQNAAFMIVQKLGLENLQKSDIKDVAESLRGQQND